MCAEYLINRVFSGYNIICIFEKKILIIVDLCLNKLFIFKFTFNYLMHHFDIIFLNLNYFIIIES